VWAVLRILLVLILVACAVYGLIFLLKKAGKGGAGKKDPWLKVLAYTPVGARNNAAVLSVGSQAWLVGMADAGMSLIAEITDKETVDAMLLDESERVGAAAGRGATFADFLQRLVPRTAPKKKPAKIMPLKLDGMARAKSRLGAL
jgi:flagellar protein FliO/FliZ